jgi:hypothetical protein
MKKGTVYLHLGYRFPDGEIKDKFFIILNTPRQDEVFITCKTTKEQKWRPDREGCHSNNNLYVLRANEDFFPLKTWIQFHEYYPISQELLLRYKDRGIIIKKAELREQTIRAIINCVSRSGDISGLYLSMIQR